MNIVMKKTKLLISIILGLAMAGLSYLVFIGIPIGYGLNIILPILFGIVMGLGIFVSPE